MKTYKYRVEYFFNHSKMGFSNSVTITATSHEDAEIKAKDEVKNCYGSAMFNKFSFKSPSIIS